METKYSGIRLCFFSFLLINLSAYAQTPSEMTAQRAHTMAERAVANCAGQGQVVAATVVDSAGNTKAMLRADGAGPHTVSASQDKAYTSASTGRTTTELLAASQNPSSQHLGDIKGFLLLGGGVPIQEGGRTIGAVGVAGAPSGAVDEDCAEAAIAGEATPQELI